MSHASFLNGRVKKLSLPTFAGSPGADAPLRKRLLLPQGELAQFVDGAEPLRYGAVVELRAGTTRGNHFHLVKHESFYVFSGELTLYLGDPSSELRDQLDLTGGDLAIIPPGVAHALRVIRTGIAIEFSPTSFDPADTYRCQLT